MLKRKVLYNISGWRTQRHLVVIESDDWGSIRMPSREIYDEFLRRGIRVDNDPYCRYDSLATQTDLANLFDVLSSVRDKNGNPAVITANTLSANPVFDKIEESGFMEYYYEPFTETLKRDVAHSCVFGTWQEGMRAGVFHPQSHGREHLCVKKWLEVLRNGHSSTRISFQLGTWGLTRAVDPTIDLYYMGAYDSGLDEDIEAYKSIIKDGLQLFNNIFGFSSRSFIATTYTWSPRIEPILVRNGVKYIQSTVAQKIPLDDKKIVVRKRCFQGTRSKVGLVRLMRNCYFEPSTRLGFDWVGDCLNRVENAFKWKKAANICAHRLNFIGSIDSSNTDRNLPMLRKLLQEIVKNWPDVEFVTSDQLGDIIAAKSHARE